MMPREIIRLGGIEIRILLEGEETGGSVSMFEFLVAAGAKMPAPHYHEGFDEVMYGMEGVLRVTVAGKEVAIGPGDQLFVPRGVVHGFVNAGEVGTRTLAVVTPGAIGGAYFRELAALMAGGGPVDPARIAEVMQRHGLVAVR